MYDITEMMIPAHYITAPPTVGRQLL